MLVIPSYMLKNYNLGTLELGSVIYEPEAEKLYIMLEAGKLTELCNSGAIAPEVLYNLLLEGGSVVINNHVDMDKGFIVKKDTVITNEGTLSCSESTMHSLFNISAGTVTFEGKGVVNGVGNNDYNMCIWAGGNSKVVINDGYFTNEGAKSSDGDNSHFDLIYAIDNTEIEINGGEFKCETPKWTLNVKDSDRKTAKIIIKGGKFHGFDPSKDANGDGIFLAEGYKVVEDNGIYTVVKE